MSKRKIPQRILYLGERRNSAIIALLRRGGFDVATLYTIDHGVAYAAHNPIDLVILDHDAFVEVDGWSPAQSFKLVRPVVYVVLVTDGQKFGNALPAGVDALVPRGSNRSLAVAVKHLLMSKAAAD